MGTRKGYPGPRLKEGLMRPGKTLTTYDYQIGRWGEEGKGSGTRGKDLRLSLQNHNSGTGHTERRSLLVRGVRRSVALENGGRRDSAEIRDLDHFLEEKTTALANRRQAWVILKQPVAGE